MKKALALAAALACATAPVTARAFLFDGWKSGTKLEKALEQAKERGIALSLEGAGLFGKNEPEELAERVEYKASTKLMGYPAKLFFSFSPETKILHTLKVQINLPMSSEKTDVEVLADAIAKQLDAKYKGLGDMPPESLMGHLSDKLRDVRRQAWKGAGDLITLEASSKLVGNEVVVVYVDEKLAEKAKAEDRRVREKRLERSSKGDKGKF